MCNGRCPSMPIPLQIQYLIFKSSKKYIIVSGFVISRIRFNVGPMYGKTSDQWARLLVNQDVLVAGISRRHLSHFCRSREFSSPEQGFTHNFRGHLSGRKVNANPTVDSVPSVRDYVTCTYSYSSAQT